MLGGGFSARTLPSQFTSSWKTSCPNLHRIQTPEHVELSERETPFEPEWEPARPASASGRPSHDQCDRPQQWPATQAESRGASCYAGLSDGSDTAEEEDEDELDEGGSALMSLDRHDLAVPGSDARVEDEDPKTPVRQQRPPDVVIQDVGPRDVEPVLLEDGPDVRGDRRAKCSLPTTGEYHRFDKMIRQVSPATVRGLIHGEFSDTIDQFLLMDCRFPFEYEGGHIVGATNYWNAERAIHALFIDPTLQLGNNGRTAIVFYCEFSSHRAPTMLRNIRLMDEAITAAAPGLLLPELYILEGGYSTFFKDSPVDCFPQKYRKMKDKAFEDQNTMYESIMRRSWEVATDFSNFSSRPEIDRLMRNVEMYGVEGVGLDDWLSGVSTPLPATQADSPKTPQCQVLCGP